MKSRTLAHSVLLRYFLHPAISEITHDNRQGSRWESALGESCRSAIQDLIQDGLLIPYLLKPDDCRGIESIFGLADLKRMAKERGLKVSGRKEDLAKRLLAADFSGIAGLIAGLGLVVCSSAGLLAAGLYDQRRQEMLRTVESALRAGGFDEAIQAKGSFEKEVGFPRWEFESEPDLEDLRRLATARPTALSSRSPTELQELRVAAGLAMLGLDPNSSVSVEDKRDIGTLLSFASVQRNLEFWRRSGVVTGARILGSSDGPCSECKKLHDIVWSLDQVPEIPNPKCTSSLGCRCVIVAELQDNGGVQKLPR